MASIKDDISGSNHGNFEFVNYEESAERLDYWLDERGYMSREDYKKGTVRE